MKYSTVCALLALSLGACGGGDSSTPDASHLDATGPEAPVDASCPRTTPTGDHTRWVVISHPFAANGDDGITWEVLSLAPDGTLTRLNQAFTMGTKALGQIHFTPDGQLGIVAQDDGTMGEFFLGADGKPTVLEGGARGQGLWYANDIVISADGQYAYVIDQDTADNDGGIYQLHIGCDSFARDQGLVYGVGSPGGLTLLDGGKALVATPAGVDLVDTTTMPWTKTTTANPFPDTMTIVGGTALTADGSTYLVGDDNQFETSEGMNRLGVVTVGASSLTPVTELDIDDPITELAAPSGHTVLSVSGYGNAVFIVDDSTGSWGVRGEPAYVGAAPQLPSGGVITADGLALVAELSGVRPFQITGGEVTDKGLFLIGDGSGDDLADIVGAIGVSP
ncbi:MAG TPA: hypothetical protein VGM88_22190 [Kofleriaceae bacterium]|jgi:hypothetical protein